MIEIYTDGSAKGGNPGIGGYAAVFIKDNEIIDSYYENDIEKATNNQMELRALIAAIEKCQELYSKEKCIIYSDSAYCVNSVNEWIYGWARNGWLNSKGKIVENYDLMTRIYELITKNFINNFEIKKIKGHNGEIGNEIADSLATGDIVKFNSFLVKMKNV